MRRRLALAALLLLLGVDVLAAGAPEDRLLSAIQKDPSFKVRMQAIRVLTKRLTEARTAPPLTAIEALGKASAEDESYLVRGLALFSLGTLKDPRGRAALERGMGDAHPFVRGQAEYAMSLLPSATSTSAPAVASGARRTLIVSVELSPGLEVPGAFVDTLKAALEAGFKREAGTVFAIAGEEARSGYRLRGSIADRRVERADDGQTSVTVVVRVTIATWPENNLRHVISARANARSRSDRAQALESLERKLIEAAAAQAVLDTMAEINRS